MINEIFDLLIFVTVLFGLMFTAAIVNGAFQLAERWYDEIERGGWK